MRRVAYLTPWVLVLCAWVLPCAAGVGGPSAGPVTASADAPATGEGGFDALTRLAKRELAGLDDSQDEAPRGEAAASLPPDARPLGPAPTSDEERLLRPKDAEPRDGAWVLKTLSSLGLVIAVILLARWGWAKMGGAVAVRGSSVVEVLSRTTVAPRNHVLLLRVGGRVLVVGDSAAGLRTLASIEDPDEVASVLEAVTAAGGTSITRGFSQLLSRTDEEFDPQRRLADEGGDRDEHRVDSARDSMSALLSRIRTLSQKGGTP